MEPKYPNPETPTSNGGWHGGRRWGHYSRTTWVVAGVILLILIIVGGLLLSSKGSKQGGGASNDESVYYDRSGFDRSELVEGIGDPAPLVMKQGAAPVVYRGTRVIQACNLLSVDDIRKAGLQIYPNSMTVIERTYLDGQSQAQVFSSQYSLSSADDGNSCMYPLYKPRTSVSIDVYQPPLNNPRAIEGELSDYQRANAIEGVAQYIRQTEEGRKYYMLWDGTRAVQIYFRDKVEDSLTQKLLTAIAKNYKRETASPAGPAAFAYDSPVFKKSYLNGCAITSAADIQSVFGTKALPFISEQVATATGVIKYGGSDDARFAMIRHMCRRQAASEDNLFSTTRRTITAETTSFMTVEGAKQQMKSGRQLDNDVTDVSASIGDDVYFSYTTGTNPEMTIRKGRFVINLSVFDNSGPEMNSQELIAKLTPLAKTIVSRIKD